jgi:hypothetical protein
MHFTHVRNLPGIVASGCLKADSLVDRTAALQVEAADLKIKAARTQKPVALRPHGVVADYVPFYFAPRSPMLYKLSRGSVPGYSDGQDPLVYLVSTAEAITVSGAACLFSDGNCASGVTQLFDDLGLLDAAVDWEVMRAAMWNNTAADPDRMRRRMAEFLAHQQVIIEHMTEIVVRSATIGQRVEKILAGHHVTLPVRVEPRWYY